MVLTTNRSNLQVVASRKFRLETILYQKYCWKTLCDYCELFSVLIKTISWINGSNIFWISRFFFEDIFDAFLTIFVLFVFPSVTVTEHWRNSRYKRENRYFTFSDGIVNWEISHFPVINKWYKSSLPIGRSGFFRYTSQCFTFVQ